jgi:hypothetical protein
MNPDLEPDINRRGQERYFSGKGRAPWDPPLRPAPRGERRRNPDRLYDDDDMRRGTD